MNAAQLITAARTELVLTNPFFASILLRLRMIEDFRVKTLCTNGFYIRYNSDFIERELKTKECTTGVLAHEVLHVVLLHHLRRGTRDPRKWSRAADFAVNLILEDNKFVLPGKACTLQESMQGKSGYLLDKGFRGMTTEHIYEKLPDAKEISFVSCGEVTEPTDRTEAEAEAETRVMIAQAAHAAKIAGKMPSGMERIVDHSLEEKVNWREQLQKFFHRTKISESSWRRPNRRFAHTDMYLPTEIKEPTGIIACCVDTSGSISGPELEAFASEMRAIFQFVQPEKLIVLYCDAAVGRVDEFTKADDFMINPVGGGGTDFRPPFSWLARQDITPDAFVYLTDGYGPFPEEVEYPVLWLINNNSVVPPWGHHLILNN